MSAIPLEAARGLRGPPAIGPPVAVESCPVPVEVAGEGVACLDEDEARWARVRAGDRLRPDGSGGMARERMAPERLAEGQAPGGGHPAARPGLGSLDGGGAPPGGGGPRAPPVLSPGGRRAGGG